MRKLICVLTFSMFASACSQQKSPAPEIESVAMVQLIVTPERFEGKKVRVSGYMEESAKDYALYTNKEDAGFVIFKNGLWLDSPKCENLQQDIQGPQNVLIEGVFSSAKKGDNNRFSGGLINITRCSGWFTIH